jgi:hypothetical protein
VKAGGGGYERVVLTRNRRIMASSSEGGRTLRLHEAFVGAPPDVLEAVGRLLMREGAAHRVKSREVVRKFLASAAGVDSPEPRRARPRRVPTADLPYIERLQREFEATNELHFSSSLPRVPIRLSARMRRKNGHFCVDPLEIAISRTLCSNGVDGEAERTLRHEMIHLWQWHGGMKLGHRADFRRWAEILGIHPRASRTVYWGA